MYLLILSLCWALYTCHSFPEIDFLLDMGNDPAAIPCNIWILGNWSDQYELEYLSESAEKPMISIGQEKVRYLSVGCLLLVAKFSSVEQLDQYFDDQKNSLLLGTYNSNNKFVHPAAQFILTQNTNSAIILLKSKTNFLTYMVIRLTASTVKKLHYVLSSQRPKPVC